MKKKTIEPQVSDSYYCVQLDVNKREVLSIGLLQALAQKGPLALYWQARLGLKIRRLLLKRNRRLPSLSSRIMLDGLRMIVVVKEQVI